MVTASNFLDLKDLFINEIAGNQWLFIFLALAVIFFVAAYFKMNNGVAVMLALVFCVFMAFWFPVLALMFGLAVGLMVGIKVLARVGGAK
jgi:uncharacterized membrane protein YGL010W